MLPDALGGWVSHLTASMATLLSYCIFGLARVGENTTTLNQADRSKLSKRAWHMGTAQWTARLLLVLLTLAPTRGEVPEPSRTL